MYRYSPLAIPTSYEHTKFPSVDERIKQLQKERKEALAAHELARRRMAERRKNKFTGFELGQLVWLDTQNIKTNYHKKIAPKHEGPFKIIEILGPLNYHLQLQLGNSTTTSMPSSLCLTRKMKFMHPTTSDPHLTLKMMKNDGKLKPSLNTENEAEDTSTMSYRKAI